MKRIFLTLLISVASFSALRAQSLISKVPADAFMVVKYSGDNFGKMVPLSKVNSYGFVRNELFKTLHLKSDASIEITGVDLTQDGYQYLLMQDTATNFVTVLRLKNATQFLEFVKGSFSKPGKTEQKNGFEFLSLSDETYVGWNATMAVIVNSTYSNKKSFYDYISPATPTVVTAPYDTTVVLMEVTPPAPPKVKPMPKKKPAPVTKKTMPKPKPGLKKRPVTKVPKQEKTEEIIEDETVIDYNKKYYSEEDSINAMKRELWYQQQEMIAKQRQHDAAEKIATSTFTGNVISIENEPAYKKIVDPVANVNVWVNSNSILSQYFSYFSRGIYSSIVRGNTWSTYYKDDSLGNSIRSAANIYFDKDKLRVEQKTFSNDPQTMQQLQSLMNSKQNASFTNYVNPGNIGYFSMSVNTEAMINYYYSIMKKYLSSYAYTKEYSAITDLYVDLLEIAIDEKALAELSPGNMLFVMHDLKSKTVTFTDYKYDEEYNRTEIKGTRKELAPDFTFVMETKNESFMKKLANLPVKYAAKEKFNYAEKGGYYELVLDSSNVVGNLYFMVKDGKAIVTTSKEVVDMTLANGKGFNTERDVKASILNNNYSFKINSSRLLEKLSGEFTTSTNKKITDYLIDNIGDVKMESAIKEGMMQSTTTMSIKGQHSNSLEFFFNMIDALNNIVENEKHEQLKKVD